jgi:hypothetical protein
MSSTPPLLQAVWGIRKHPRVMRNPQPTQGSSATRCKSQSNALKSHSISLEYATKQGDECRGSSLAQSMSQVFKESRERLPKPAKQLFIATRTNIVVTSSLGDFLLPLDSTVTARFQRSPQRSTVKRNRTHQSHDRPDTLVKPSHTPASQ